jgi:hypothetical protein
VFENIIVAQLLKNFDAFCEECILIFVLCSEIITALYENHMKRINKFCG